MILRELDKVKWRIVWSWRGAAHVWKTEGSFHQWIWLNVVFGVLAFVLPLSLTTRGFLLMGGIMVLAMECVNTALERIVDDISTEKRDAARQAKDAGSAAVAICGIGVGVAWVFVLIAWWTGAPV
ncbi:diacylglycerol kinase [Loktanella sp. IMCC34160]|uniref:diacylglycerol kinase n=1 Tax=Loktanella sp. IMCC34160 TaxID=2510646 RepID=UPI0026839CD9